MNIAIESAKARCQRAEMAAVESKYILFLECLATFYCFQILTWYIAALLAVPLAYAVFAYVRAHSERNAARNELDFVLGSGGRP